MKGDDEEMLTAALAECVFDITLMARNLIDKQMIVVEDSRDLFSAVFSLAKEFESSWEKHEIEGDYMELIDEFAKKKLLTSYGKNRIDEMRSSGNMSITFADRYDIVIASGKYDEKRDKVVALAQLIYANDRSRDKEDCLVQALEEYEDMTGAYWDPTHEEYSEALASII